MPGKLIANRFAIKDPEKDLLGRGGMGEVYRATDTQTGEAVAVKALNPEILAHDPSLLERFEREGEALRQLNHPNIVHMVSAVEEQGQHYLVMEFVGGGSLKDLLNSRGSLPAKEVVKIALEVSDALTRAHHLGIIHRDLKPANVLLAEDGTPRLADFGIAHIQDSSHITQTGILIGTVDYLGPEVCQGETPDELSDIWAFGVMLFEMLTGKLPFEGKSMTAKLTAILTQPVPDLAAFAPGAPDALVDLVNRMLEKDRLQRIPSVRLVGAELETILKERQPVLPSRPASTGSRFAVPAPAANAPRHNLPVQTTPFVGRKAELVELDRLLSDPNVRLVTILGVGGMGKTRLAIEAGERYLTRVEHGVYFVSLAGIRVSEDITPATARVLGLSFYEGSEPRQRLLDHLHEKNMLLVFDNFEHLLAGADLITDIIQAAPRLKVLITSRARLNLQGEQLFHLSGMEFPDWETPEDALEYSAVKLFLQSARRLRPGFMIQTEDLKYIARICRLVEGMPLGILLAAAWIECLTPAEISEEMMRNMEFLSSEARDLPERQRSLRAVFDHSWNLLSEQEQRVLRRLSVFRGGFTREAAQQVTGATLRELAGLVDKSLLQRDPAGRYDVHELLRQFNAEKLARWEQEKNDTQDRHCMYYAGILDQCAEGLISSKQKTILVELLAEIDNIQAGWDWAISQARLEDVDRCLEGLGQLYRIQGWFEHGEENFSKVVTLLSENEAVSASRSTRMLLGKALLLLGRFRDSTGTDEEATKCFSESLTIFRETGARKEEAYVLSYLGGCGGLYGNDSPESSQCQEALAIFREVNDLGGIALSSKGLAWALLHQGNYIQAKQFFQDSLDRFKEKDDQEGILTSLGGLGYVNWILGDYQKASQLHQEMLALSKAAGDKGAIARSIGDLGIDACGLKEYEESLTLFHESLALYREIGHRRGMADEFGDLGEVYNLTGQFDMAYQFGQESLAFYSKIFRPYVTWPLRVIGNAACGLGNLPEARRYLHQALERAMIDQRMGHALLALVGIAALLKAEGEKERAFELLTFVSSHPVSWQLGKDQALSILNTLEAELPPAVVSRANECARRRNLEETLREELTDLASRLSTR